MENDGRMDPLYRQVFVQSIAGAGVFLALLFVPAWTLNYWQGWLFFGVRSYREQQADGRLTFGRGFAVGILIVLISCAFYVGTWEIIYFKLAPNFMSDWTAHAVEQARASGASQAKIDETVRQMAEFKRIYDNPLTNAAVTFLEPFPIGLLVALISAGVLRRRPQAEVRPGGPVASAAVR